MKKALFTIFVCLTGFWTLSYAQPDNDKCINAIPLVIPADGKICIDGTTIGSKFDAGFDACRQAAANNTANEVWFTYIVKGSDNTYTVTPKGSNPIKKPYVAPKGLPIDCSQLKSDGCEVAPGNNDPVTAKEGYTVGTQVWVQVAGFAGDGDFEFCIQSVDPPPTPGNTCPEATILCNKATVEVTNLGTVTSSGFKPSCFKQTSSQDIWYKFTVGKEGMMEWKATPFPTTDPDGVELDWAIYDITNGCPPANEVEIACNYHFSGPGNADPIGMQAGSTTACPIQKASSLPDPEFCPPVKLELEHTYAIIIDNFDGNNTGFELEWGGDFEIAPTARFDAAPTEGCNEVEVTITDNSIATVIWDYNFGTATPGTFHFEDPDKLPPNDPPAPFKVKFTEPGTQFASVVTESVTGCKDVHSVPITVFEVTVSTDKVDANCGASDGKAIAIPSGEGPFTYSWSNGITDTDSIADNLAAGTYTVTVTDAGGCTETADVTVNNVGNITANLLNSKDALCNGDCNGEAEIEVTGGEEPYTYSWSNTDDTGPKSTKLCAGTHTVSITDNKGCTTSIDITISEPPALVVNTNTTPSTCGQSDGSATVTISGGTAPYSVLWDDPAGQTTETANNLPAKTYNVTVTDANGCTISEPAIVNDNSSLSVTATGVDTKCGQPNGEATATPSGGNGPYTYSWDPSSSTDQTATGLLAGTHTVEVTDADGCKSSATVTLNDINTLAVTTSGKDTKCAMPNGEVTASPTGGSGTYNYEWTPSGSTDQTATGVLAGWHKVEVTDTEGCVVEDSVEIGDFRDLELTATGTDVSCDEASDGTASALATGGDPEYTYVWVPQLNQGQDTIDLSPGTYTVAVIDSIGCTDTASVTIGVDPAAVVAAFTADPTVTPITKPTIDFTDESTGATVWAWFFGDGPPQSTSTEQHPQFTYDEVGVYTITLAIMNEAGCVDTTYETIEIKDITTFYAPNVFSPNKDGYNDTFNGTGVSIIEYEMWIYDRWGLMIYETDDIDKPWHGKYYNGTDAPEDVYVWVIKIEDVHGKEHKYIGHVSLIR